MSIEKITSKILSDAQESAEKLLTNAKRESDNIVSEAKRKADEICRSATERGSFEKEQMIERRKAVADIDGRKMVLQEKQKLISECFDKTIDKIANMEKSAYLNFIVRTVEKTGIREGEIILNTRDREEIGAELIKLTSEKMESSSFVLSEETRNIKGGFVLKNGDVFINGTIESLVDEAKESLVGQVAERLFQ